MDATLIVGGIDLSKIDSILIVSFGGPEGVGDVMPFLQNVLRGKNVPEARMKEVAHHYEMFDGVSPINAQNRELKALLEKKLKELKIDFPVFWGNRNWNPYIKDALLEMKAAGKKHALAYFTSAYGSYSGCKQYLENIETARQEIGDAPEITKLKSFHDHPNFIKANVENILEASKNVPDPVHLAFTAHSIPVSMAEKFLYVDQLQQVCATVASKSGISNWKLVYQSRSGPPSVPWLAPDINDHLKEIAEQGVKNVIISPIGFISDHMEVMYDLDVEAKKTAKELGMNMVRAKSAGNHPLMIDMIVDMVLKNQVCEPNCCSR